MTYHETINQAIELVVLTDEDTGVSYLEPRYRDLLRETNLHLPDNETPGDAADQELWEILKLEVEKRNAKSNVLHALAEWAYTILTQTIDPALLDEENELMKNITEYMQTNQEVKEKKVELEQKEKELDEKQNLSSKLPVGLNFSKRTD